MLTSWSPSTNTPHEALSATVSWILIFQSWDARIDDLEAGHDAFGGGEHIGRGHARALQVFLEQEGDLALGLGLDERVHVTDSPSLKTMLSSR